MYRLLKMFGCIVILALSTVLLVHRNAAADDTMSLDVVGYNHTDHDIGDFSVNSETGSYVGKHDQHGFSCCVSLSAKYTPGMTVRVTWTDEYNTNRQSRTVPFNLTRPRTAACLPYIFCETARSRCLSRCTAPGTPATR